MGAVGKSFGRLFVELGQGLERFGLRLMDDSRHLEQLSRHRRLMHLGDKSPAIGADSFIAPNAAVIGAVSVGKGSSVFYGGVVRAAADKAIKIGEVTTVGDRAVLTGDVSVGDKVVISPGAILSNCTVASNTKIGAGAVVADGCKIGASAAIGHGAVLKEGTVVRDGELWSGVPAKKERDLKADEIDLIAGEAEYISSTNGAHLSATALDLEALIRRDYFASKASIDQLHKDQIAQVRSHSTEQFRPN